MLNKQSKITQAKMMKAAEPGHVSALAGRPCQLWTAGWGPSACTSQALEESVLQEKSSSKVWEPGSDSGPLSYQLGQSSRRGPTFPAKIQEIPPISG